ncbi:unnamed protein product [Pipistrellus nathusii]|uniref:Interferon lambda-4-like n=1 Tax=Pipistrellus nathusii TaxID=59473 RepID=A0ABN9ZK46_PIPNA
MSLPFGPRRALWLRAQHARPSWTGRGFRAGIPSCPRLRHRRGRSLSPSLCRQEEETRSWRPWNCSFRPRRGPRLPGSCAGLRRVARGLSDAQAVLSSLPSPELFPGVAPTLELLASARRDVEACLQLARPGSSRKGPRAPRRRPHRRRGDSPGCHEATIVFNLLRLLAWDLKLAARSAPCL